MTGPVTAQIQALFERHGLDATQHQGLVTDLMKMTYDEMDKGIDAVLGRQAIVNRRRTSSDTLYNVTSDGSCDSIIE